jgi:flagellar protein FlaF
VYRFSYGEIVAEDMKDAKRLERRVFERAIRLMREAESAGIQSSAGDEAIFYLRQFWQVLIEDLARPGNGLPDGLRASLMSIGLWVLKELAQLQSGDKQSFKDVIEINSIIRDGLITEC